MDLLAEKRVKIGEKEYVLKVTNRTLYKTQIECGKKGLIELFEALDKMDLSVLFHLVKYSMKREEELSLDELMEADLDIIEITEYIAQSVQAIFEKKEGAEEKK